MQREYWQATIRTQPLSLSLQRNDIRPLPEWQDIYVGIQTVQYKFVCYRNGKVTYCKAALCTNLFTVEGKIMRLHAAGIKGR